MNKKNLSVVLAGAMLATSVAPVLAATEKEYSLDNRELLNKEIVSTMKTKMLTSNPTLKDATFVTENVKKLLVNDASAYGIRLLDEKGNKVEGAETYIATEGAVKSVLDQAKEGYTVELVERKTNEFYGELIPGEKIEKGTEVINYDNKKDFENIATTSEIYKQIVVGTLGDKEGTNNVLLASTGTLSTEGTGDEKVLLVKTNKPEDLSKPGDTDAKVVIKLAGGSQKIDGRLPLTADGKLLDYTKKSDIAKFDHFDTLTTWTASKEIKDEPTVTATYKMTAEAKEENTIKAEELYDGVVLTAKGTELAAELANAAKETGEEVSTATKALVRISNKDEISADKAVSKFTVTYYKNATTAYKTITIYSSNHKEVDALYGMLTNTGSYKVGIVGGENRYETAVNVAKAQGIVAFEDANAGDIVLVNGDSLVDGLSAAPLAARKSAPVLLTKADSLPESTKGYISSLLSKKTTIANKKKITVTLVGGKSVLTNSLIKELEEMGVTVKRLGGDNREATSLAVAKEIKAAGNENAAFVVGGNGEADAMAISAVAAKTTTPIIVSSVHGLSEDALEYLKENSAKGDVTVVGGESVVSKSEEEAINESLTLNKASRIAGANRFETNAAIIKEFYKEFSGDNGAKAVIVVKDGVAKKSELVDALAAANFAAANNAPIVLATNSLNAAQKNALLNMDIVGSGSTKVMAKAVQVGNGVERSVLEAVAGLFGLSNK